MMRRLAAFAFLLPAALLFAQAAPAPNAGPDLFAASRLARAGGKFGMLLRQFRADEPTLAEHHEAGAKAATPAYQAARDIPAGHWVWQRPFWFVFRDGPDQAPLARGWGPEAACGEPDTKEPGDHRTAWATKEQDQKGEWLLLEYETPVRATAIEVHETHNPGALAAVSILTPQGEVLELWRERDVKPAAEAGRVLQIDLPLGFEVERVLLQFDSESVPGWNEIDAVGLRDDKGKLHWAKAAEASSTYADSAAPAAAPGVVGIAVRPVIVLPEVRVQPIEVRLEMPRLVVQARQLQAFQLAAPIGRVGADGESADAEKKQLQQRVGELEVKVRQLEAELARAKAGK